MNESASDRADRIYSELHGFLIPRKTVKMDDKWAMVVTDTSPGEVTVSMYERKDGSNGQIIRYVLTVHEMVQFQDALNRALAYHLRMLT